MAGLLITNRQHFCYTVLMNDITFITGNQDKADQLARDSSHPILHKKIDLTEIQSFDPLKIAEHKAKEAYRQIKNPVLIEDTSLTFLALGKLPGPYIKWFLQELGNDGMCKMLDAFSDRKAHCIVTFVLYDGEKMHVFADEAAGSVADKPRGTRGFGWDPIFIHEGFTKTRGEMTSEEYTQTSPRRIAVEKLHKYLT